MHRTFNPSRLVTNGARCTRRPGFVGFLEPRDVRSRSCLVGYRSCQERNNGEEQTVWIRQIGSRRKGE